MKEIIDKFHIDLATIGFTMLVLALMVAAVALLIVFPVRKLMAERRAKAEEIFNENQRLIAETDKVKAEYEAMTKEAGERIAAMAKDAAKSAEDKAQQILDDAKRHAAEITAAAKKEAEAERVRMEQYFKAHITSIAVDMASKVLEREVKEKDNSRILDDCLEKWSS